ncbi:putative mannosyl-oligosaccharide alpha-1,2-mannosidase 1B [Termitomyces sp. J132]|nr:putative mannosyl-oligosaccharide alpha-1,2-mannosidase 1B [Termitomyces sp. J132]
MLIYRPATLFLVFSAPAILAANVQNPNLQLPPDAVVQKAAVKKIFTDSFAAYKKFAFGHDDLSPLSQSFSDGRNGWEAHLNLPRKYIMGLDDLFQEAVTFSSNIDFSKSQTPDSVSVFETTIRYLGGLLSAFELSDQKYPILLEKAKEVADKLAFAWVGENALPFGSVNFTTNSPTIAAVLLTFAPDPLPDRNTSDRKGLPAQGVNPQDGKSIGGYVTWGGGSDSYFEYLIKYARLSNTNDPLFANTWHTAVDSSIKTLLRTSIPGNHVYLADFDDSRKIRHIGSHLACFNGGNWILGGKLLNNDTIVNIGLQLADACWNTYASTQTGIGPESFAFISSDGNFTGGTPANVADLKFNAQHGFYITDGVYIQRPEVLETNFYAWRATGDTKYLDRAASAVASFDKFLQTPTGYAGINDVNNVANGLVDDTESFWFAEVLKYLYLTFDDPNHISLDEYVFNTEAHPFKAPPAKSMYGTNTILPSKPFTIQSGPPLPAISPSRFDKNLRTPQ